MLKGSSWKRLLGIGILGAGLWAWGGCSRDGGDQTTITIKGSDTMVHLVSEWAEAFMDGNPGLEVMVTGGGSGTGIAALLNRTTDICAASRDMSKKEYDEAEKLGIEPKEITVAMDGIAVIVNPGNSVSELSLDQVRRIYTGDYANWSQVGGPDLGIVLLSRESSSGTYVFFQEHVLNKQDFAQSAMRLPATSGIISGVGSDRGAIGYVGLGYAEKAAGEVKSLGIRADGSSPAVAPSVASVQSGEYSIARPLFLYVAGEPEGALKEFIDFCLGAEGQKIVADTGYVPVK